MKEKKEKKRKKKNKEKEAILVPGAWGCDK
jgi:hypothetical protein